jgi:hypothetical protein
VSRCDEHSATHRIARVNGHRPPRMVAPDH